MRAMRSRGFGRRSCRGQAMVEYVVATGLLLATLAMLSLVLYTFREYGARVLDLVAYNYP